MYNFNTELITDKEKQDLLSIPLWKLTFKSTYFWLKSFLGSPLLSYLTSLQMTVIMLLSQPKNYVFCIWNDWG